MTSAFPGKDSAIPPAEEYRSLYRKYRPQSPDQVLGQDHVVRALAGAVRENRLAHAFLFSGPRGTGKTSSARILAKMVNCERGPTAEPDGTCDQCRRIEAQQHLDVWEIDAASHGGVDDARELRERAPTAPAEGREKVYIIDEAQRLSREAFDALLKLFEEPPPGVRFVLCTTEPHKMPATIVGRCQKFEFRRGPTDVIASHLSKIAVAEHVDLHPDAADAIARQSEGSFRDALSLLEQAALLGGAQVGVEEVSRLIGVPDLEEQLSLADAVAVSDAREVFGIIHRLVEAGHDLRHFTTQVTGHFRNLLLALSSPDDPAIIDVPSEVHPRLVAQAGKFSAAELNRVLSLLLQAQTDMRWTTSPRLTLELALVRAALPETDPQPAGLISRIERLERLSGISPQGGEPGRSRSGGATPSPDRGSVAEVVPGDERAPSGDRPDSSTEVAAVPEQAPEPGEPSRSSTGSKRSAQTAATGASDIPASSNVEAAALPEGARSSTRTTAPTEPRQGDGVAPPERSDAASPRQEDGVPPERSDADSPRQEDGVPPDRDAADSPRQGTKVGAVDTEMLRRGWEDVLETLKGRRHMRLRATAELATVGAYDGDTIELVFPPGREFAARMVEDRSGELKEVLGELFGIKPKLRFTVRQGMTVEPEADEPPPSPEAAEALLRTQFGAEVVEEE